MIPRNLGLRLRPSRSPYQLGALRVGYRAYTATAHRFQDVFPSLADDLDSSSFLSSSNALSKAPQTLTEKIVQRYSLGLPKGKFVKPGDYVTISPYHCMSHDNSFPISLKFLQIGASKIHNNRQVVMTLDHDVQNKSEQNLRKYYLIEEFAKKQGVDFYPAGRGIGHQIMVEEGYAWPGTMVVASDSHSNMYGGIGCLGTAIVRTDAASIWATGRTWWQIPPIARVNLTGVLPRGVTGKDVIIALCGLFNNDVLNYCIEFTGSEQTLKTIPIDDRLAIANMTTEWGALSGLFPIDSTLQAWLRSKATSSALYDPIERQTRFTHERIDDLIQNQLVADKGATYAKSLYLNLSTLSPYISGPNSVKIATPLKDLEGQNIKIDKAYLVSCTNSRASDIARAAKVFKDAATAADGKIPKIADGVKFYIAAASVPEQEAAEDAGDWQALLAAGAEPLPAGCGPCIGLGTGLLEPGETGISASNRNFKGRMGSTSAMAYLASPEIVAASALNGEISGPGWYEQPIGVNKVVIGEGTGLTDQDRATSIEEALDEIIGQADSLILAAEKNLSGSETASAASAAAEKDEQLTELLPGFPEYVEGEIVLCDVDNLNTDGIYPGKYTYQDGITSDKMAEVCMENYDPEFSKIARKGDILASGFNFGCGSSREQAATAILAKGIPMVVAGSFGNIFSRNSINNALMGVEVPRLIQRLRETFSNQKVTTTTEVITEPQGNSGSLDSPQPAEKAAQVGEKVLTRRTGWNFKWDVRRSLVEVTEGPGGEKWTQKVGELPPNVQDIIASGGLEKWVAKQIAT